MLIIQSIDSISRDEPLTQYIINVGISRARYTIMHFEHHHRNLRLISNRISVYYRYIAQVYVSTSEVKKSRFGILLLSSNSSSSSFFNRPSAIVSYLLTLVYM